MSRDSGSWWTSGRFWGAVTGLVALVLVIAYLVGMFHEKVTPGAVRDMAALAAPAGAPTHEVRAETYRPVVEVVGTVASAERVRLSSRVNAYVRSVAVGTGDTVRKGQVLAELDDRETQQQHSSAEADFSSAEADYRRTLELFRNEAATQRQLDLAQSAFQSTKARMEEIDVLLSHSRIVSPMDGVVVDRSVEVGDLATLGGELFTVYDPGRMRLEAPVPVRLAEKLKPGDELEVLLVEGGQRVTGVIQEVAAVIDPRSRTRLMKVRLSGSGGRLLPGMFGRLEVAGDPRTAMFVPAGAVYQVGQLHMVQIVADGQLTRRIIRTGPRRGDDLEVLAGLAAGETILRKPILGKD